LGCSRLMRCKPLVSKDVSVGFCFIVDLFAVAPPFPQVSLLSVFEFPQEFIRTSAFESTQRPSPRSCATCHRWCDGTSLSLCLVARCARNSQHKVEAQQRLLQSSTPQ
jgi:hypothetical protein